MKRLLVITVIVFLISSCTLSEEKIKEYAQRSHAEYSSLMEKKNYIEALKILEKWKKIDDKDPELYIDYFNLYLAEGMESGISFDTERDNNETSIELADPKTNQIVGYINGYTNYNQEYLAKAIISLNEGIIFSRDRLDMYFGKIHVLNEVGDYKTASSTIQEVLMQSVTNQNNWLWSKNEKIEDGERVLLDSLNDYYAEWINIRSDQSLEALLKTSTLQVDLYPNNTYGYNFLAYYYILKDQKKNAIPLLLIAEKIDPNDLVIINNIARLYEDTGNKVEAVKYWDKVIMLGTPEQVTFAKERKKML